MRLKPGGGSANNKQQSRKSSGKSTGKFCNGVSSLAAIMDKNLGTIVQFECFLAHAKLTSAHC